MSNLIIGNAVVRVDSENRYSLNDLHKAAGGEQRKQPRYWLENQQIKDLVEILSNKSDSGIPLSVIRGGTKQGTYVCKQLVYAYAMWLSPEFHLQVIEAYDALANGRIEEAQAIAQRQFVEQQRIADRASAKLESIDLTNAVKEIKEADGKTAEHYHYSNEYDMINRIVLGVTSRKFRSDHGIDEVTPIRDVLSPVQIKAIKHLQRSNTSLIELGVSYEERKAQMQRLVNSRYAQKLTEEVHRLEA